MNQLTVSLWGDEAFASILAQKSLWDIVTIVARDTSPPLHYVLLHFWMGILGKSEVAIRAFPVTLFLLLSLVVFGFARDLFGKQTAKRALLFTLLNPFLFLYAFEARMYMLLALSATASMWFFVTKRWALYTVTTIASLYTHHFAIFVVFVQMLSFLFTNFREILRPLRSPFIRSLTITSLLYAPWLPALFSQTTRVASDFWLPRPTFPNLSSLYAHFAVGPQAGGLPIEKLALLLVGFLLLLRGFRRQPDLLLYLWLLLPALLTYAVSQVSRPIFFDRYLIVSTASLPLLISSYQKRLSKVALTVLFLGLVAINIYVFQHPVKQPFAEVAQFVHRNFGKDQVVINYYTNALHYFELRHYEVDVKIYSPSGPLPFWVGTALIDQEDILMELPKEKTILIMASGDLDRVNVEGFSEVGRKRFRDLYLLQYQSLL